MDEAAIIIVILTQQRALQEAKSKTQGEGKARQGNKANDRPATTMTMLAVAFLLLGETLGFTSIRSGGTGSTRRSSSWTASYATSPSPRTLYDKIWDEHLVDDDGQSTLVYIDRHLVHEVTSPQAFEGLRLAGRGVRRPDCTLVTVDHNVPTSDRTGLIDVETFIEETASRTQVLQLEQNVRDFGLKYFSFADERQGIVHIIGPEQGFTLPGCVTVCGDSHTATHGAFGALAFGIGTSEVEHVLATQVRRIHTCIHSYANPVWCVGGIMAYTPKVVVLQCFDETLTPLSVVVVVLVVLVVSSSIIFDTDTSTNQDEEHVDPCRWYAWRRCFVQRHYSAHYWDYWDRRGYGIYH